MDITLVQGNVTKNVLAVIFQYLVVETGRAPSLQLGSYFTSTLIFCLISEAEAPSWRMNSPGSTTNWLCASL